jgi:hypothetical protein
MPPPDWRAQTVRAATTLAVVVASLRSYEADDWQPLRRSSQRLSFYDMMKA